MRAKITDPRLGVNGVISTVVGGREDVPRLQTNTQTCDAFGGHTLKAILDDNLRKTSVEGLVWAQSVYAANEAGLKGFDSRLPSLWPDLVIYPFRSPIIVLMEIFAILSSLEPAFCSFAARPFIGRSRQGPEGQRGKRFSSRFSSSFRASRRS